VCIHFVMDCREMRALFCIQTHPLKNLVHDSFSYDLHRAHFDHADNTQCCVVNRISLRIDNENILSSNCIYVENHFIRSYSTDGHFNKIMSSSSVLLSTLDKFKIEHKFLLTSNQT
jgi:hypothetical protein